MSNSSRREFTKKSLLLALGPIAGENAFFLCSSIGHACGASKCWQRV